MDLLDRYLHDVRTYLPKSLAREQQDDITAELAENLRAQMDDHAVALGRPLGTAEEEAILQQHGHPMVVAGRYQMSQGRVAFGRELIGPVLYPFYLRTLAITMGISLAVYAAVAVALAIGDNPTTIGEAMTSVVMQVAIQFTAITAIFAAAEHYLPTMRWSAQRSPSAQSARRPAHTDSRIPRLESLAEIVAIVALVAWLWLAYNQHVLLFGPALDAYRLAPVWQQVALPTLLVLGASVAQAAINLFRPGWVRLKRVVRVATDLAALGIVIYLLQADTWVMLANGDIAQGGANDVVYFGLLFLAIGCGVAILLDGWKLLRGEQRQQRAQQPPTV